MLSCLGERTISLLRSNLIPLALIFNLPWWLFRACRPHILHSPRHQPLEWIPRPQPHGEYRYLLLQRKHLSHSISSVLFIVLNIANSTDVTYKSIPIQSIPGFAEGGLARKAPLQHSSSLTGALSSFYSVNSAEGVQFCRCRP